MANQSGFGTVPLFDVTFNSLAAGTSPLAFDPVSKGGLSAGDENGISFTDFLSFDSSVNITAAPTQVSAPEIDPASAASALTLFVGGLLVLSGRRSISPLATGD